MLTASTTLTSRHTPHPGLSTKLPLQVQYQIAAAGADRNVCCDVLRAVFGLTSTAAGTAKQVPLIVGLYSSCAVCAVPWPAASQA
jgi:hypothetical protein